MKKLGKKIKKTSETRKAIDIDGNSKYDYCYKCGQHIKDQKYCQNCGSKLKWNSPKSINNKAKKEK